MPDRDPVGAAWLVLSGALLGMVLTIAAVAPSSPVPPIAAAPDGGIDGAASMIAAEPAQRYAGELQAIDVEHAHGFVVGAPLR